MPWYLESRTSPDEAEVVSVLFGNSKIFRPQPSPGSMHPYPRGQMHASGKLGEALPGLLAEQ